MRRLWRNRNSKLEIRDSFENGDGRRTRLQLSVALAVILALWNMGGVCAAGQRASQDATAAGYRISGVVVDAMTGVVVPNAEVWTDGETRLRTVTNGEGRFVFDGVEEGKYPLNATATGYVKEAYNQHGSFSTGIAVRTGLDSEHVVFKLHRQAAIYGRVTDERGDAVRRARVMLFSEGVQYGKHAVAVQREIETNDLGAYRFAHLLPGNYYVGVAARPWWAQASVKYQSRVQTENTNAFATAPSGQNGEDPTFDVVYPFTYFAGATEDAGATPLLAKAGDAIEANVQLTAVPAVHVLLTNMDAYKRRGQNPNVFAVQKPFGAAVVPINNVNSTEIAAGVYEVGGLPPGEVRLSVNSGGESEWDSHGMRLNAVDGERVDATARATTSIVSGVVVLADGSKEEMLGEITLHGEEGASSTKLEKDGTFRMPALDEGTYEVAVNTRRRGNYVAKVTGIGAKVSGRAVKIEGAGEVRLTVTVGRGLGQVEGAVKIDGKPTAGVMVLMVPEVVGSPTEDFEELTRMDQSDSDGTFTLRSVVPGKYVLMAIQDGWDLEWKQEGVLGAYREKGMKVAVAAAEEKSVEVEGISTMVVDRR